MKTLAKLIVCLMLLFPAVVPFSSANGAGGAAFVGNLDEEGGADPNSLVDREEPANNQCEGAEAWPVKTIGVSTGRTGSADPSDWSSVELYRTESLEASVANAGAVLSYAQTCDDGRTQAAPLNVEQNGKVYLAVSPTIGGGTYRIEYAIAANDANTGRDIPNVAAGAHDFVALPTSESIHAFVSGSITNRPDLPFDKDWYRIGTGLAHALDPGEFTLGLLTVTFEADCYGGTYVLALAGADGLADQQIKRGCGMTKLSCIATAASPVYARVEILNGGGTGYDFYADLAPLYIVSSSGQVTDISPAVPWCDPLSPVLLGLTAPVLPTLDGEISSGSSIVDKYGNVVATVTRPRPF